MSVPESRHLFICISASTNAVCLIKPKKSMLTAHRAITELLGYKHEIKNHLPLLAIQDLNWVLISSEWSTLLGHGAASARIWSRNMMISALFFDES